MYTVAIDINGGMLALETNLMNEVIISCKQDVLYFCHAKKARCESEAINYAKPILQRAIICKLSSKFVSRDTREIYKGDGEFKTLKEAENILIDKAMAATGNVQVDAAEFLGISPRALHNRLKRRAIEINTIERKKIAKSKKRWLKQVGI